MTLRFGLIGVGNIAPVHAAAIRGTPDAELVAVATRRSERGQAFVAEFGGTWYGDYHLLLSRADVDVVVLCTPHDLHLPMTVDAAAAGKHILCEKPMARTVAECDQMIAACERARVTLGIIFQTRYEPLAQSLKHALMQDRLGRLLWTSSNTVWYRSDEYYRSGAWRGTWAHEGGGVLINQAIHTIDMLQWLSGMPARVTARMKTLNHQIEVEDAALGILEYDSGGLGLIQATTVAFPGLPERLELFGTRGSAVYYKGQGRLEWHFVEPREDRVDQAPTLDGAAGPMTSSAAAHTTQYREFADALRRGAAPSVDGREGRKSVEIVEALYRSARLGAPVSLPITP